MVLHGPLWKARLTPEGVLTHKLGTDGLDEKVPFSVSKEQEGMCRGKVSLWIMWVILPN